MSWRALFTVRAATLVDAIKRNRSSTSRVVTPRAGRSPIVTMDLDGFARTRFTASTIDVPGTPAVAEATMFHAIALLALGGALLRRVRRAPGGSGSGFSCSS